MSISKIISGIFEIPDIWLILFIITCILIIPFLYKKINKKTVYVKNNEKFINVNVKGKSYELDQGDIEYYKNKNKINGNNVLSKIKEYIQEPEIVYTTAFEEYYNKEENKREKVNGNNVNTNRINPVPIRVQPVQTQDDHTVHTVPNNILIQLQENNGKQSVHDSFVQNDIKNIYKKHISGFYERFNDSEFDQGLLDEIEDENILDTLKQIKKRNNNISNINNNEVSIINSIYSYSKNYGGNGNIRENLILQLKDSRDSNGGIVCPTGTVNRVISSLEIENPENSPKDISLVNNEIMAKFNNLYNDGEVDKQIVKNKILDDYPNEHIKELANNLIDSWIDEV